MKTHRLMLLILALAFGRTLSAQQVSSQTVVFAVYQGERTAGDVLSSMRKAQGATDERIESSAVVSRSPSGKVVVHERPTQSSPAVEDMLGKLGDASGGEKDSASALTSTVADSMRSALRPGTSAVIAVLDDKWAKDVARDLQAANARSVMLSQLTSADAGARTQ
jgi:hypothetical protein